MAMMDSNSKASNINIRFQPPFLRKNPPSLMDPCDEGAGFSAKMLYEYPLAPPRRSSLADILGLPGGSMRVFEEAFEEENIEFRFGRP